MSAVAETGSVRNIDGESLQAYQNAKLKIAEMLALPSGMNPEQLTLLFKKAVKPEQPSECCACITKVEQLGKRCVVFPVTRGIVITIVFLGWATSVVSTIVSLIVDNSSDCRSSRPALILSIAAVIAAGIAAGIYGIYDNVKKDVEDAKRDKELIDKFILALEDHQNKAKTPIAPKTNIPEDHLKRETQQCLRCYDQLPEKYKEKIPHRDLWILGLLKELPLDHPMRAKLKRMIGSAEGKSKADSMEKSALMEKRLHFVKPPEDRPVDHKGPTAEAAAYERLAMPSYREDDLHHYYFYKDLIEVEQFIGAPVSYIEADGKFADRHCKIRSRDEVVQKACEVQNDPEPEVGEV